MGSAFQMGWQAGREHNAERRERKQLLTDEERKLRVTDLYDQGHKLAATIPSLSGADRDKAMQSLTDIESDIASIYHPNNNPGALQKDWGFLKSMFGKKPQPQAAQINTTTEPGSPSTNLKVSGSAVTLPGSTYNVSGPGGATSVSTLRDITLPAGDQSATGAAAPATRSATFTPATPFARRQQAQRDTARKKAELDAASAGLTPEQQALADSRKNLALINQARKDFKAANPDATPAQEAAFMSDVIAKQYGTTQKPLWKPYRTPDGIITYQDASRPDLIPPGLTAVVPGAAKVGLKFDTATGQVIDLAANKRYSQGDPSNPPEVAAMFQSADTFTRKKQEFQEKLAQTRGEAFGWNRPQNVLDTANGNAPTSATYNDMRKEPGRYIPATEADKALAKENLMEDIAGTSKLTREAITNLKEDFPVEMKAKIVLAMRADDPHAALDQLIASGALGTLTDDQWQFLVATRQLAENAMAMRSILGAGQGSEDVRMAIQATLPSLLTPDKSKALVQLDAFDKTLARLHRGVPKVPLRTDLGGGGGGGGDDMIWMKAPPDATHPDGRTGQIHRSQKDQFIQDHPGSVEVTQ